MVIAIEELTAKLKAARKKKGLSQRSFAKSIGVPQSRLSRIENGVIDPQTSKLLELARSLDLELVLVPRQAVPVVNHLVRQLDGSDDVMEPTPLYRLGDEENDEF
ncbi:MAG: helix-turn-helix transcriptional regulator [Proteobacteria bacterium]|nr:helix-turn-helix transcriptional regulator [Pseudomonadota bacterium]